MITALRARVRFLPHAQTHSFATSGKGLLMDLKLTITPEQVSEDVIKDVDECLFNAQVG